MEILNSILDAFGLNSHDHELKRYGSGLIHSTFVAFRDQKPVYILQRVNHQVFRRPEDIAHNIRAIGSYLQERFPEYKFTHPITDPMGNVFVIRDEAYFRLFHFIPHTHTIDTCTSAKQAYEASAQFGLFTSMLNAFPAHELRQTISGFHDLSWRYAQFLEAMDCGDKLRIAETKDVANFLASKKQLVDIYASIQIDQDFKLRVTHHDTKISNVLFDPHEKGVCVIDLDTVMPGYFISDVGDMMRTYVPTVSEEEKDVRQIEVRKDFIEAIRSGYLDQMDALLTTKERSYFLYAGKFMIYMQALRFYTDHINNDVYYGASYMHHNLFRAKNQIRLLEELEKVEKEFS